MIAKPRPTNRPSFKERGFVEELFRPRPQVGVTTRATVTTSRTHGTSRVPLVTPPLFPRPYFRVFWLRKTIRPFMSFIG